MFFAFLSARLRRWVIMAFVLPLVGRLLQTVGPRVAARNPQIGNALMRAGDYATQRRRGRRGPGL